MDIQNPSLNDNVRDWYMKAYPSDDYGSAIDADITFQDLVDHEGDTMQLLGRDSIIHERTISKLVEIQTELDKENPEFKKEKDEVIENISYGAYDIADLSDDMLADKDVVMALLDEVDSRSNEYDKYNAFMKVFNAGIGALDDKDVALRYVTYRCDNLQDVSPELRDDKDVVLAAVKHDSQALKYASDRLKDDPEVVIAALRKTDCYGLLYASDRIKDNIEVVKMAMKKNEIYIKFASERIQKNPELVTAKRSFNDIAKAAQEKAGSKSKEKDHSPNNRTR